MTKHVPKQSGYYWFQYSTNWQHGPGDVEIVEVSGENVMFVGSDEAGLLSTMLDLGTFLHAEPLTPQKETE